MSICGFKKKKSDKNSANTRSVRLSFRPCLDPELLDPGLLRLDPVAHLRQVLDEATQAALHVAALQHRKAVRVLDLGWDLEKRMGGGMAWHCSQDDICTR